MAPASQCTRQAGRCGHGGAETRDLSLTDDTARLTAFGNQLIQVHIWLRDQLARLRANAESGLPRELRAHCLIFYSALTRHHIGEDAGAFPALAEQFPELRPVLTELENDHEIVAGIMRRLEELFDRHADAATISRELDGLTALLESHFYYEEKKIVAALNALTWSGPKPEFLRTDD